jgi:nicotinamide-nucleotide amidase
MNAAILAIGSELLGTDRLDTNSLRLTAALERHGVGLVGKAVVGDSVREIETAVRGWRDRVDLLLLSGGLGPTTDDLTRDSVARALGVGLARHPEVVADIEAKFARLGIQMPEVNLRQAEILEGAEVLANRRGTAPGQRLESAGCTIFLIPGVPDELDGMIEDHLAPWLERRGGGVRRESRTLRVACVPESEVEQRLEPAYREFDRRAITVLASPGDIRIRIFAAGSESERQAALERMSDRIAELVGIALYSRREDEPLEAVVGEMLRRRGATLATAESCTGGRIAARLTGVAGSSDSFLGGVVTYSDRAKRELLGVARDLLEAHGAVSEPVAREMAEGVRRRFASDYGIGVTGIAGPGGGTDDKPVGLVHLAVSGPSGETDHRHRVFPGSRHRVQRFAAQLGLEMLRRRLLRDDRSEPVDGPSSGGRSRPGRTA